ncbi:Vacuolar protein sorting-associated protein 41 [Portunus trituberculatus]|uniref:Vacuolar protein sorting-associated protein 41 n=1 Tax=Portunus trituberculatus TaxID=210409 RepID=A0A5B7JDA1_PORTR|nr:Vacuolar protein sorting-associated protein 41 [Portunus trituberculatus]
MYSSSSSSSSSSFIFIILFFFIIIIIITSPGTTKLTLYEKALFGQLRSSVLAEGGGAGPVRAMRWAGQFLAWATDSGVRVTDMATKSIITLIKRDHSVV